MANNVLTQYPHRRERDGLFDSICPTCFATVVRSKPEADMAELEKAHVCNPAFLAERSRFAKAESTRHLALTRGMEP
jgi:hypothetical protein